MEMGIKTENHILRYCVLETYFILVFSLCLKVFILYIDLKLKFVFQNIKGLSSTAFETNNKKIIEIIFSLICNCYVQDDYKIHCYWKIERRLLFLEKKEVTLYHIRLLVVDGLDN